MKNSLNIRTYRPEDRKQVIDLWTECGLLVPWNNPRKDLERKMIDSSGLMFIGERDGQLIATCMAGYDGHRGWIYYLAVKREFRHNRVGRKIMAHAESALKALNCPKIDLMVRRSNTGVIQFYRKIGYTEDPVVVLSKRLIEDEPFR